MPAIRLEDLREVLLRVEKPARYTGGELHSIVKDLPAMPIKVALAFPDTYEIGMSHLGLKILYQILNRRPDVAAERVFCPWPDMEQVMREHHIPLYTLETRTPVREFDWVGISLQHELCYTNILTMLDLAGIPLRTVERAEEDPLIIAGGPVAFSPEPIAEFIDLFLIGDGEEAFPRLLDEHLRLKQLLPPGLPGRREKILRSLTRIEGVYAPSLYRTSADDRSGYLYVSGSREGIPSRFPEGSGRPEHPAAKAREAGKESVPDPPDSSVVMAEVGTPPGEEPVPFPIRRAILWDLNKYPFPTDTIVPFTEIVHDRVSVEIARGCVEGCRFCQAGIIYRPVRERNTDSIVSSIVKGLDATGHDEASIVSLSDADYSCFPNLVEKVMDVLEPRGVGLGLSSLRVYGLTDKVTEQIARVKKTGFTIAPEAGTQRLRDVINKGIREEDIEKASYSVFRAGWSLIKLYFMIGQPTETQEDVVGIARTGEKVMGIGRRAKADARDSARQAGLPEPEDASRGPSVHLSASSFIPKPHSTFQWSPMDAPETLRAKQELVRKSLRDRGIKFKHHFVDESVLECVLSRGDRRLGRVIERAWRAGARFDSWGEHFRLDRWLEALTAEGLDVSLFTREIPPDSLLPWDHIDTMVAKDFLLKDYLKATRERFAPACMRPVKLDDGRMPRPEMIVCYNCGVACDLEKIKEDKRTILEGVFHTPDELKSRPGLLAGSATEPQAVSETQGGNGSTAAPPSPNAGGCGPARWRYRLSFRKTGTMVYLSHLDLVRTFTRALRRARVPLRMSQGFSPHPEIAFGPALALGVESRSEYLEFTTDRPVDARAALDALAATLPPDLGVRALVPVSPQAPSLSAAIGGAIYTLEVPLQEENAGEVARKFEDFLARSEARVVRRKKDRDVEIEVRGSILLLEVERSVSQMRIRLGLRLGPQGAVKPAEVLEAALGAAPASFTLRRDELLVAAGSRWVSPLEGAGADAAGLVTRDTPGSGVPSFVPQSLAQAPPPAPAVAVAVLHEAERQGSVAGTGAA